MSATMLGQGLYDAAEVGLLMGHHIEWVVRWSTDSSAGPAIVSPSFDRMFSFADLVSFRVALQVRDRGVPDGELRTAVETLRKRTGLGTPLANSQVIRKLATSGRSFLSEVGGGEFDDIGKGGQGVFKQVVEIHLARIDFDATGQPMRWRAAEGVVIDPAIQAGAPCVAGTRIPTATIHDLLVDADPADVALDLGLTIEAIGLADEFEKYLASGAGVLV